MKKLFFILISFSWSVLINAQTALYNSGNIQIHNDGEIGFHTNLINDGIFDDNRGLAGFYGAAPISISGAFAATFYDIEIANMDNVTLNTSLNITNNTNFILGHFRTPRTTSDIYLNFFEDANYNGSGDMAMVDGYATITNKQNFTFPIGDGAELRPLILNSTTVNAVAKCAYFFENINSPVSFSNAFNATNKTDDIGDISALEFWRLEGAEPSTIRISWNERSNIGSIVNEIANLGIVGWEKASNQWMVLSNGGALGDQTSGFVTSSSFIPDDYEIITFANVLTEATELINTDNFLVTPNGDGVNDALEIPEIALSPNNTIHIFDRFGLKVFEMENYTNTEFTGFATTNNFVISKEKGLPSGVYFYVLSLDDIGLSFQGFLYLAR